MAHNSRLSSKPVGLANARGLEVYRAWRARNPGLMGQIAWVRILRPDKEHFTKDYIHPKGDLYFDGKDTCWVKLTEE